jgi:phenylacetate-coenzyme A ligase PaaK-like adenylate-forming protein
MHEYEVLRQQHVALFTRLIPLHVKRLSWSVEQLRIERRDRLRDLLRIALSSSSWHRQRLAGIDPDLFEEDDLQHIRPMTKDDLMANWDDIVTDRRVRLENVECHLAGLTSDGYLLDEFHAIASGGSTGTRGVYLFGWESWAVAYAGFLRTTVWDRAVTPGADASPNTLAMVAARHPTHMTSAIAETFSNPAMTIVSFPISLPIERIVAGLNEFQPTSLVAYASALGMLAREAREGRLQIAPRRIISTSEPLFSKVRQAIEEVFQAPVANIYGTSEAGPVAIGCWRGAGMHLCDDLVIVEPVDRSGRRVGVGVRSDKIYLTAIANPTLPLIRFEMSDQVELLDCRCSCGSAPRLIADVEGRVDDVFAYERGVLVHPHVFRSVLCRDRGILEYQVCQTATGADVLAIGVPADATAVERAIASELRRLGVRNPLVTVRAVNQLERQQTGKIRRFVSLSATAGPRPA